MSRISTAKRKKRGSQKAFIADGGEVVPLNADLSNPEKAARVEWILEMYGEMMTKSAIIQRIMRGRPADDQLPIPVPGVVYGQACRYYNLAMDLCAEERQEKLDEKIRWHRAQLVAVAKASKRYGRMSDAIEALDRVAMIDGVKNAIEAAGRGTNNPTQVKLVADMTAEELAQLIEDERKKLQPAEPAHE